MQNNAIKEKAKECFKRAMAVESAIENMKKEAYLDTQTITWLKRISYLQLTRYNNLMNKIGEEDKSIKLNSTKY